MTALARSFTTLLRNTQYCAGTLTQPSVSTHMTLTLPLVAMAACPAPSPAPPATGKIMSAPCWMNSWLICSPLFWSVKDWANVPAFWFCSSQPSTWTFLPFCLL